MDSLQGWQEEETSSEVDKTSTGIRVSGGGWALP